MGLAHIRQVNATVSLTQGCARQNLSISDLKSLTSTFDSILSNAWLDRTRFAIKEMRNRGISLEMLKDYLKVSNWKMPSDFENKYLRPEGRSFS